MNLSPNVFQAVPTEDPASCVQGLAVEHQASGGAVWLDDVALGSFYTFQWKEEVHTITVMSRNSVGFSAKNSNMTLVRQPKRELTCQPSCCNTSLVCAFTWT